MSFSGVLSGIVISTLGFSTLIATSELGAPFISIPFGLLLVCIGLYMIINTNKEDKIEEIRKK